MVEESVSSENTIFLTVKEVLKAYFLFLFCRDVGKTILDCYFFIMPKRSPLETKIRVLCFYPTVLKCFLIRVDGETPTIFHFKVLLI